MLLRYILILLELIGSL